MLALANANSDIANAVVREPQRTIRILEFAATDAMYRVTIGLNMPFSLDLLLGDFGCP